MTNIQIYMYEASWTASHNDDSGDRDYAEFKTMKELRKFFNEHKNDPDKHDWWCTSRDEDWHIIDDVLENEIYNHERKRYADYE